MPTPDQILSSKITPVLGYELATDGDSPKARFAFATWDDPNASPYYERPFTAEGSNTHESDRKF